MSLDTFNLEIPGLSLSYDLDVLGEARPFSSGMLHSRVCPLPPDEVQVKQLGPGNTEVVLQRPNLLHQGARESRRFPPQCCLVRALGYKVICPIHEKEPLFPRNEAMGACFEIM